MIWLLILALYLAGGVLTLHAIRKKWMRLEWFYPPTPADRTAIILAWPCLLVSNFFWKGDAD